jgi:hypothetical protein
VKRGGFPGLGKKYHGHGLSKVIKLETGGPNGREDRGIGDCVDGNGESARAQDEVAVCCCTAKPPSAMGLGLIIG